MRISYALTSGHEPAIGSPLCKDAVIGLKLKPASDKSDKGDGWVSAGDGKCTANLAVRYLKENAPAALLGEAGQLALRPWGDK